jgi:hypothetical protein
VTATARLWACDTSEEVPQPQRHTHTAVRTQRNALTIARKEGNIGGEVAQRRTTHANGCGTPNAQGGS